MPVVLGSNSIAIDGRVIEIGKSDVYIRDTVGTIENLTSEPSVILGSNIATVAAGFQHTIFLDTTGKVYSVGDNEYGQLGLGNKTQQTTPVPIPFFNNIPIQSVAAGALHTIFLATTGKVYSVGYGANGHLGLGNTAEQTTPVPIPFFNNIPIQSVAAGDFHTIFLATTGKVYSVGSNNFGQLGLGDDASFLYSTPQPITHFNDNDIPIQSISAGKSHTIFLDTTGKVYSVGFNNKGQLGLEDTENKTTPQPITHFNDNDNITIKSIAAESDHTIFLDTTGKVYSVGDNSFGQLGLGDFGTGTNRSTPELIPHFNDNDIPIQSIAAGGLHTIFLATTGEVYSVGRNNNGQLGLSNTVQQSTPEPITFFNDNDNPIQSISAGGLHTIFLATTGKVYSVGYNFNGQLGLGNTTQQTTPVPIPYFNIIPIKSISAGQNHTIFLATTGKVYSVGRNEYGQLGLDNTDDKSTPVPIPFFNNIHIQSISSGNFHTIFLDTTGKVYSVGRNNVGQLGLGNKTQQTTPVLIPYFNNNNIPIQSIAAGGEHTIFLATTGKVYSVGFNEYGQLGLADTPEQTTPVPIPFFNEIPIQSISSGSYHTIFLAITGKVYSTGYNVFGQLGLEIAGAGTNKSTPEPIPFFNNNILIQSISAGGFHTIFLDTTGKVYSVGYNNVGQLGLGDFGTGTNRSTPVLIPHFNDNDIPIKYISAGEVHTIFLDTTGKVYSVGRNDVGQLGLGDFGAGTDRYTPELITYFNNYNIQINYISSGGKHTIFLDTIGKVYSVGNNIFGQLGLGNTIQKTTPEPMLKIIITDTIFIDSSIDNRLLNHKVFRLSVGHYRISLNTETVVDINNGSDIILKGDYNITVGASSSIIPDINNILQNIPLNPTANTNMVVVRYHLMTPVTERAQWTYNSSNADVYHMGNVGIGTTNPTSTLHIEGNIYSTTYSGGSKNFKIEHPLKINKWLYHGCIEGPRFDNIYRGKTLITKGKAVVDIDRECNTTGGMTSGTFTALNTNYQLYLQNNQTYDSVKGKINDSIINIECENTVDDIEIYWLVVGERHDEHVINTPLTDSDGNLICEHYFTGYNKYNSGESVISELIVNVEVTEEYTTSQVNSDNNIIIQEDTSNTSNVTIEEDISNI